MLKLTVVSPIRWDVLPQQHMCTEEIMIALFFSYQVEKLRDVSGIVMLLFLLRNRHALLRSQSGMLFSLAVCSGRKAVQNKGLVSLSNVELPAVRTSNPCSCGSPKCF